MSMDPEIGEIHENEEFRQEKLEKFRRLIDELDDFNCPQADQFLLRFLRTKKYNLKNALQLLKNYYTMRKDNPKLFENLNPNSLMSVLEKKLQVVLGSRDPRGRQVFIFRAGAWDPRSTSLDDIFRCNYLYLEEMTSSTETQVNGISAIVDFNGFGYLKARHFTLKHARRMVNTLQGCFPVKFKEFHLLNTSTLFKVFFAMVKPLLTDKIRNRIHLHDTAESLDEFVGRELLPDFLGGDNTFWKENDWSEFCKIMIAKEKYYCGLAQYGFRHEDS